MTKRPFADGTGHANSNNAPLITDFWTALIVIMQPKSVPLRLNTTKRLFADGSGYASSNNAPDLAEFPGYTNRNNAARILYLFALVQRRGYLQTDRVTLIVITPLRSSAFLCRRIGLRWL